jgi:copper chaperone NosL
MRRLALAATLVAFALGGCDQKEAALLPRPVAMTKDVIGHYCGMNLLEHPGPKGQIIVKSLIEPVWFSSARDAIAFTMLPDEPKDIQAIYVSDMGKAPSWDNPGAENWVEARKALFVIRSSVKGGDGQRRGCAVLRARRRGKVRKQKWWTDRLICRSATRIRAGIR